MTKFSTKPDEYPGHRFALRNLKEPGWQTLQFYQDPMRHPYAAGTSCQEVLRALIKRVKVLDDEKPWVRNEDIIRKLRECIVLFESRALEQKVSKGAEIEDWPIGEDGHLCLSSAHA